MAPKQSGSATRHELAGGKVAPLGPDFGAQVAVVICLRCGQVGWASCGPLENNGSSWPAGWQAHIDYEAPAEWRNG